MLRRVELNGGSPTFKVSLELAQRWDSKSPELIQIWRHFRLLSNLSHFLFTLLDAATLQNLPEKNRYCRAFKKIAFLGQADENDVVVVVGLFSCLYFLSKEREWEYFCQLFF